MNAFTRSNLAVAERQMKKVISALEAMNGERSLYEYAAIAQRALYDARDALEEVERAVKLDEMEAAE